MLNQSITQHRSSLFTFLRKETQTPSVLITLSIFSKIYMISMQLYISNTHLKAAAAQEHVPMPF